MSFTNNGYAPESYDEIIARIINNVVANIPDVALDPSSLVYQWIKILATEVSSIEQLIEVFTSNMTVIGADEFYTMLHGAEVGVFRKLATPATGYVMAKSKYPTSVPLGTQFFTSTGVTFQSTETVNYDPYIVIQRGRNESDGIPFAYPNFVPAAIYSSQTLESGALIDPGAWWYESGAIYWKTHDPVYSGMVPTYGSYYYVTPSGEEYYINIPVQCTIGGTSGNVGAGTITQYDTASVSNGSLSDVHNASALTNGTDAEPLNDYKRRILEAKRVPASIGYIQTLAGQVEGVKYAKAFEIVNDDITIPSDWSDMSTYTNYVALDTSGTYSFSFSPSDGVATLQGVTLHMSATGTPGNLAVYLTVDDGNDHDENDALVLTNVDLGVLNKSGRTTPQSVFISLKRNGISKTTSYRVFVKPYNCDASNHWKWYIDTSSNGNSYVNNVVYSGGEFIRKTHYRAPAFNIVVHPYTDSEFETVRSNIQSVIENYVPVGVQYEILEARKVYLSLTVDIVKEADADFTAIQNDIVSRIENYLGALTPGDDVVYSQVEKAILQTEGVLKEKNLEIWINDNPHSSPENEMDQFVDFDEVVELDTNGYYGGVTIREVTA